MMHCCALKESNAHFRTSLLVRTLRAEARAQCALTAKRSHGALLRDVGIERAASHFLLNADCSSLRLLGAILRHYGVGDHVCGLTEQSGNNHRLFAGAVIQGALLWI